MIQQVEIAICTYRRPELLRETLESITHLKIPDGVGMRVIVVNNDSADHETDQITESFRGQMEIALAHETETGHTFARNRAIDIADGDLMVWTDDDVIVDTNWIFSYVTAANQNPDQNFWGGRIIPEFRPQRPDWIGENWEQLKGCFAARDLGGQAIPLTAERLPYGANFAIRTDVQKKFKFDIELGRRGEQVFGEDELDLFRRLLQQNHSGGWVPRSELRHLIPIDRATESYVWNYFVGQGRALVAKQQNSHRGRSRFLGTTIWNTLMWKFKRQFSPSEVWVSHLICAALAEGQRQALK